MSITRSAAGAFVITAAGGGRVLIDDAYLADEPTNDFGRIGCREDVVEGFRREGLTFLRWGGSMANCWGYAWRNMRGDRRPYDGFWFKTSSTGFLYREFVQMAAAMNLPCAFSLYAYESVDHAAALAGWLKNFKNDIYVQIGNEECASFTPTCGDCTIGDCRRYCASVRLLVEAMRKANPRLKFVSGLMYLSGKKEVMDEGFRLTDGVVDYWDLHPWVGGTNICEVAKSTRKTLDRFHAMVNRLNPRSTMKIAVFEENGGEHGLRRALAHAAVLGVMREEGAGLLTSCPANALQPYRQNENGWDQGQIFLTPDKVWLQPCGWAQQMASANHRDLLVSGASSDPQTLVSATAARDRSSLVVHLVNAETKAKAVVWKFPGADNWRVAKVTSLTGDGPYADNPPEDPERVAPRDVTESFRREPRLAPYSYTVVEFRQ